MQKLNEQIKKARENLDETEWEHNISEQKKLLSELQDEYSDFMNDKLNDIEGLVKEATDKVNQNLDDISRSVKMAADQVGYTMSGAMNQLITNGSYAYYDRMFDGVTSVIDYLSAIYQAVQGVTGIREERSTSSGSSGFTYSSPYSFDDILGGLSSKLMDYEPQGVNYNGSYMTKDGELVIDGDYDPDTGVTLYNESGRSTGYTPLYTGTRIVQQDYDEILFDENGNEIVLGRRQEQYRYFNVMGKRVIMEQPNPDTLRLYFEDNPRNAQMISPSMLKNDPDAIRSILKKMYQKNNPGFYVSDSDFKNILLPFATGGLADYTGLAMLHGSKQRPELVLNADDTEKFLEAAKLMRTPVLSALAGREFTAPLTGLSGGSGGITIENFSVDFDINNPESYEDILAEARNDHRFERLIDSIVFSKIRGGSAFGEKNRIHF